MIHKISGGVFWMIEIKALFLIYNYSVKLIKKTFFHEKRTGGGVFWMIHEAGGGVFWIIVGGFSG